MAAAETDHRDGTGADCSWRAEELERAGYETPPPRCSRRAPTSICTTRSIFRNGCSPEPPSRSCSNQDPAPTPPPPPPPAPPASPAPSASLGRMRSALTFLASIPSPSSGTIDLGPLTIHMYGLMLLAGIAACIWITGAALGCARRRLGSDLPRRRLGVGAGIVGARLYHLATSWNEVPDEWWGPFAVWEGGLGIWGGIAGGILVGGIVAHRSGASVTELLDAAAPGLLVAQAIGRIGNWWNQELFGKPTEPALGARDRPSPPADKYIFNETFHPTFLYEALWNLLAAGVLLPPRPSLPLPAAGALRPLRRPLHRLPLLLETLRIDPSTRSPAARERLGLVVLFVARSRSSSSGSSSAAGGDSRVAAAARSASSRGRRWPSRRGRVRPRR